jgi:DNA-binding response OmpR family regulator
MATILVIDDDAQVRRMMNRVLSQAGHEVHEAANGRLGVDAFRAHRPSIVITDILMPEQEGIETIRALRREGLDTRIIAVSGGGYSHNMLFLDMARQLGADSALRKPFRAAELLDTVNRLLDAEA